MSELTPKLPPELEQALAEYYSVPIPSAEFAARLEGQLRRKLEQTPGKQIIAERISFMKLFRTRPVVAILIVLFILLVLSGVVYALGRSLGYIPGYGVVDQNVPMRILAEPVSQTRDGITITIDEIILTPDKMFSTVTTENIPNNLMLPMSDTTTVTCEGNWVYQLPDGSQLKFERDGGNGSEEPFDNGDLTKLSYQGRGYAKLSVPININEITDITLHIPCVTSDIPVGSLPENWEFHLKFIPAPAGMLEEVALPVIEYTPSPLPTNVTETPQVNPITVTKVIDTGDSFILIGEFVPPPGWTLSDRCCDLRLFDGKGQEIVGEMPMDIDPGTPTVNTPFAFTWVRQFKKEGITLPVTVNVRDLHWKSISMPFEFDTGVNPQPGDEYPVNQPFEVDGRTFLLERIRVISPQMPSAEGGYAFLFTWIADNRRIGIGDISIEGYPPSINSGFSGGGWSGQEASVRDGINFSVEFASMPKGKLNVNFTFNMVDDEQVWTLDWQP